jgi:ribosomal protein L11 methylase PrmA
VRFELVTLVAAVKMDESKTDKGIVSNDETLIYFLSTKTIIDLGLTFGSGHHHSS